MDANSDKWALVTGASSGIGRAVAEALAERGFGVVCAARRVDRLAELARDLGNRAVAIELDLRDPASATSLVERLPAASRDLAVLVNCAGHDVGGRRRFDRGEMDEWANVVETNLLGTMRVTQVIPGLTRTEFAEARWGGDKAKADEFYGKFPSALEPVDVARMVVFAVEQPPHVTISDLMVLPSA